MPISPTYSRKMAVWGGAVMALALLLLLPSVSHAAPDGGDFVNTLVRSFYDKTQMWEPVLRRYALVVLKWLVILEVCWLGIRAALGREQLPDTIKHFVVIILAASLFAAVINHYSEWAWQLINGLKQIGLELTTGEFSSDSPFITGLQLVKLILGKMSLTSPVDSLGLLIAALVILVCFALISAQVVLVKCEAMLSMMAAMVLLGFGGSAFTRDYAVNAIRYVISVAFKLFVLQLVLAIGVSFIRDFNSDSAELQDIFVIIGAAIILLALVKSLPDVVSGIISGSHVGGGSLLGTSAAVAGGAIAGAGLGVAASQNLQNIKDAAKVAGAEGKTGVGKLAGTAANLWSARQDAKDSTERSLSSRSRSEMQERLHKATTLKE